MKRFFPLIRREALRLIAPTAIALWALILEMRGLGGSFQLWMWNFSTYESYAQHPSMLLRMDWFAFAFVIGMGLSLAQHFTERSANPSLWWEKLPYSRWERMGTKALCAAFPLALLCLVGFVWTRVIVAGNAEWIARVNAGLPGIAAAERLLRSDRLAVYWIFLFSGACAGYVFFGFLCQIFGHWWRAALIGGAVWMLLMYCIPVMREMSVLQGRMHSEGGETEVFHYFSVRDMESLWPWIRGIWAAAAGLFVASVLLEKRRPFERSGLALYAPAWKWYIMGAIALAGIAVMLFGSYRMQIPAGGVIVTTLILMVTPLETPKWLRWKR